MIWNSLVALACIVALAVFVVAPADVDIQLHQPVDRADYPACCEVVATLDYSSVSVCFENAMDCPGIYVCADMLCVGPSDLDGDGDVDLADFAEFQNAMTGPSLMSE